MENELIFQHDGAPPYYAFAVRLYLDVQLPEYWSGWRHLDLLI